MGYPNKRQNALTLVIGPSTSKTGPISAGHMKYNCSERFPWATTRGGVMQGLYKDYLGLHRDSIWII